MVRKRAHRTRAALLVAAVTLAACSTTAGGVSARGQVRPSSIPVASSAPAGQSGRPRPSLAPTVSKLMVVVLENHSRAQVLAQMPLLTAQANRYGQAVRWYAVAHPSLPNYLMLAGGSTFGIRDDRPPSRHQLTGQSVLGQLAGHGDPVAVYAEGEPGNCTTHDAGRYAVRHNPWTYFVDPAERAACRRFDVPAGTVDQGRLHDDVAGGQLPTYSMLIPDTCNDAHSCPLSVADTWLQAWLSRIEVGPDFRGGRLAVAVTFDEDDGGTANHIAMVLLAAQLHHKVVTTRFTHASLAAAPSRLVGLPPLREAVAAPDVLQAFGLR